MSEARKKQFLFWFDEISRNDVGLVGGKNSSLGEMVQGLAGVEVPFGFAISSYSYFFFLEHNGISESMRQALTGLDIDNLADLQERGSRVRGLILGAQWPPVLEQAIRKAYRQLSERYGRTNVDVAVRSSATAEDLPDASFAGQQESFLNVFGEENLLLACRSCMASLFTNRAICYREQKGFDHFSVGLSVGVQLMVRSDQGSAGVMFTIDTESGFQNAVLVTGCYGLGENVVQGAVTPDEFLVFKPTQTILSRRLGAKEFTMVYSERFSAGSPVTNTKTPIAKQQQFCLTEAEVLKLASWAMIIEKHYGLSMDIEWAKDGKGDLFIVQARPETVFSQRKNLNVLTKYKLMEATGDRKVLASGSAVGNSIGTGVARVLHSISEMESFQEGEVLVADFTDPDWEPVLKKSSAVVTNRGGRTCHAAIISRELGIPCLVGTVDGTLSIPNGASVTLDNSSGDQGKVFEGNLKHNVEHVELDNVPTTKTKVALLLGNPGLAFSHSMLPNDGCGLARMEFIISSSIKAHPLALLHPEKLDAAETREILRLIGRPSATLTAEMGRQYFVEKLSEGVALLAAAFYPKSVILRFSDFKSDEYANLIGGGRFEPKEDNPMLGWRGASRYYDGKYMEGFELECQAIKRVRNELGLKNLEVMIPFVRTVQELHDVQQVMSGNGLKRGQDDLRVIMMCEIPSNCVLAPEFLEHVDGFSIGSNDLTQLVLGIDRNSAQVARLYDERNDAVKKMIHLAIQAAKNAGKYIGICGQAPSDYPEFCEFLVGEGIGSISVQPDRIIETKILVSKKEKALNQ